MTRIATIISVIILSALCGAAVPMYAQSDSPCNQGRSNPDPRNERAMCFPELGRMVGTITRSVISGSAEEYGKAIAALGDLNRDSLADWGVLHTRCDTLIRKGSFERFPSELLIYKGVKGGLPSVESGERIGPREIASSTGFLAVGDWDGDGNRDIATRIQLYNDTTDGGGGYDIAHVVIFWGNAQGRFSLDDTTRLMCDADRWLGPCSAASVDISGDGVDDLIINSCGAGFTRTVKVVDMASVYIFDGHDHQRWGRDGIPHTTRWRWWGGVPYDALLAGVDQDGDGVKDVALYHNTSAGTGSVTVLYGHKEGGLPDTSEAETADLLYANGHYALFSDVTGDGVPELLLSCGSEDKIKVFIGLRGQRVSEQYGDGHEGAHPGDARWWGRPWAEVWQPVKINANWFFAEHVVADLGDGNLDGINDIWCVSWPYLLCYSGGEMLDSLVDGLLDLRPGSGPSSLVRLGDIDGSGRNAIAINYDMVPHGSPNPFPGGIIFMVASRQVPDSGTVRQLPEGTGRPTVGVSNEVHMGAPGLHLRVIPNPAREELRVEWSEGCSRSSVITMSDIRGGLVLRRAVPVGARDARLSARGLASGEYLVSLATGGTIVTTTVVIR